MPDRQATFAAVRDERERFADFLETLTPDQWEGPSLCAGWRVRDVVGHLVYLAEMRYGRLLTDPFRYRTPLGINRSINAMAIHYGREEPRRLVRRLRASAGGRFRAPLLPPVTALGEVITHSLDATRPLGIERQIDPELVVAVLDLYKRIGPILGARGRVRGLRLVATDIEWSTGMGPDVRGPAASLLLAVAGRPAGLDDLEGEGLAVLRERC
ncbi:MAG: maleylpyruvate isomerase family mycothiol-dependent enzyme [Acidimicrobiales bacterium]